MKFIDLISIVRIYSKFSVKIIISKISLSKSAKCVLNYLPRKYFPTYKYTRIYFPSFLSFNAKTNPNSKEKIKTTKKLDFKKSS